MSAPVKVSRVISAMTIPFTVTLVVTERDEGNFLMTSLLPKIQAELNRIERSYSAFLPTSLVCRYQMGEKDILIDPEFQSIYATVHQAYSQTDHLFDPYYKGVYDPTGYVKGWAVEKIFREILLPLFQKQTVQALCLNGGGDMQLATKDSSDFSWRIGIEHPDNVSQICARLNIKTGAVATSGYSKRGKHIRALENSNIKQVTIIGQGLGLADIYATAGLVANQEKLHYLITKHLLTGLYVTDQGIHYFEQGEIH